MKIVARNFQFLYIVYTKRVPSKCRQQLWNTPQLHIKLMKF